MKRIAIVLLSIVALAGCRTSDSTSVAKAGKGEEIKRAIDKIYLAQNGDLYCNPTYGGQGKKIAYNIKFFEVDAYNNVWALSTQDKAYRINVPSCLFSDRKEMAFNVEHLTVVKGYGQIQAAALLKNGKIKTFNLAGGEIANKLHDIEEISYGCSQHYNKKGREYSFFARTKSNKILGITQWAKYETQDGTWTSIAKWKKHRDICK